MEKPKRTLSGIWRLPKGSASESPLVPPGAGAAKGTKVCARELVQAGRGCLGDRVTDGEWNCWVPKPPLTPKPMGSS